MALKRYMFVEDFPKTEEEAQKEQPSPRAKATKEFGVRTLHQIAKCEWEEHEDEESGTTWMTVTKGEVGGWIEKYENLAQEGECWVHPNAIVCGDATVTDDAQIESGEVGDAAQVMDEAVVKGKSIIKERARVYGFAVIDEESKIGGTVRVNCKVQGKSEIEGNAFLFSVGESTASKEVAKMFGKKESEGFLEESVSGSLVTGTKIDGECQLRGKFYVKDSELHDRTVVNGLGRYTVKYGDSKIKVNLGWVERSKVYGKSLIYGQLIGVKNAKDVTVKGVVGLRGEGDLRDYISGLSLFKIDYNYTLWCMENFK